MHKPRISALQFRATGAIFVFDERYPGPAENIVAGYSLKQKKVREYKRQFVEGQVDHCDNPSLAESAVSEYQLWLQSPEGLAYKSMASRWRDTGLSKHLPLRPSMSPGDFLKRFNPACFFHFTDKRNLPSIRKDGLLPLAEIRRRRIVVPAPGGNEWSHEVDERRGLDQYVHLCLFDQHPMEWVARVKENRIADTTFIRVSTEVIYWDGIRFTAEVANKSGVKPLTLQEASATLDFPVVYDQADWRDPEIRNRRNVAKKYELLVPSIIAPHYLAI